MSGWGTPTFLIINACIIVMLAGAFTLGYRAGRAR